jgi:hypothetical protein
MVEIIKIFVFSPLSKFSLSTSELSLSLFVLFCPNASPKLFT